MALRNWHYGKLIILWIWGILLSVLSWYWAGSLEPERDETGLAILGIVGLALVLLIPACLSVVTWKWLGGKEGEPPSES